MFLVFLASSHPAIFAASWAGKPPFHFKNLQVCNCLSELYSINSKLAGAHGHPGWSTLGPF